MNCIGTVSWDDISGAVERCAGPNWYGQFVLGLESLIVVLIFSAILAYVIVRPRHD